MDLVAFCESFLGPDQVLEKVIYFTASPLSPQKNSRQSAFLNANRILHPDKFEVIRGKYMSKQIECPYCKYSISKPEEKRTDVNISVRMMADCVQDKTDVVVLISADTDLIPPLQFIHTNYPDKKVKVFFHLAATLLNYIITSEPFIANGYFSKRMNVDFVMLSCPILSQLEISLFLYLRNGNS